MPLSYVTGSTADYVHLPSLSAECLSRTVTAGCLAWRRRTVFLTHNALNRVNLAVLLTKRLQAVYILDVDVHVLRKSRDSLLVGAPDS